MFKKQCKQINQFWYANHSIYNIFGAFWTDGPSKPNEMILSQTLTSWDTISLQAFRDTCPASSKCIIP